MKILVKKKSLYRLFSFMHFVLFVILTIGISATTSATSTQYFEYQKFEDFQKGEFEGTTLNSEGEVHAGWDTLRMELVEESGVWSYAKGQGDDIYLGTGNRGAIYLLRGDRIFLLTRTESVVITAMAVDSKGNVYAGGMPGAEIYRFTPEDIKKLLKEPSTAVLEKWKKREYKSEKKEFEEEKVKEKGKDEKLNEEKLDQGSLKVKEPQDKEKGEKKEQEKEGKGKGEEKSETKKRIGPEPWAKIKDAEQIWSLLFDPKRGVLLAGTGPSGKVYSIDASGRINVFADTGEDHVLSLADLGGGKIAAGTGNRGRLFILDGAGRGKVLWDFQATEVKSIVKLKGKDGEEDAIICAVNRFKSISPVSVSKPSISSMTKFEIKSFTSSTSLEGEGEIDAIIGKSSKRVLLYNKSAPFTFLEVNEDKRKVYAGDAEKGRIYEVDIEGNHSILFDFDERQVLTFCMSCSNPFVGTSDPSAIYRILKGSPAQSYFVSEVLDAGFPAVWGKMILRSQGKISWQTRTGNTEKPDKWWTEWSKPSSASSGYITSDSGRFIQFRLKVPPGSSVWNARVYYLPANQQAVVKEVTIGGGESKGDLLGKKFTEKTRDEIKHDPVIEIKWNVDNPDGDEIAYTLFFAKEGEEQWIPILKEGEKLSQTNYKWDTTSIPAGYYLIKVVASDIPSNDPKFAVSHFKISKPILVDNDPPQVNISVALSGATLKVSGRTMDNFSNIRKIQYSIDGKSWKDIFPVDLVFDDPIEDISFEVSDLQKGAHTLTLRAWDEAWNLVSTGENFSIK